MAGFEPAAFHLRSERATTALHPLWYSKPSQWLYLSSHFQVAEENKRLEKLLKVKEAQICESENSAKELSMRAEEFEELFNGQLSTVRILAHLELSYSDSLIFTRILTLILCIGKSATVRPGSGLK